MGRKGRILFLAVAAALCLIAPNAPAPRGEMDTIGGRGKPLTVWIASDQHYLSPRLTDHGEHFLSIIQNGDAKLTHYSPQISFAFIEQALAERPDAVILSGDLTLNGSYESLEELAAALQALPDAGVPVYVIPGNHDVDGIAYRFVEDGVEPFDGATTEDFRRLYANLGYDRAFSEDSATLSYAARLTDDLWLLLIDVNAYGCYGALPDATVKWAEARLKQAKKEGARVVAVSHQNLLLHNERFIYGFQIIGAEPLIKLYQKYGVAVNFSGHMHIQHIMREGGVTDIASSSLAVSPNQFGVLSIAANRAMDYRTAQTDVDAYARRHNLTDPNLLDFAAYSSAYFDTTTRLKREGRFGDYDDEAAARLLDFSVLTNRHYFAGTLSRIPKAELDAHAAALPDGYVSGYFASMAEDAQTDMTRWSYAP